MKKLHILLFAIIAHGNFLYPKSKKTALAPITVNLAVDNIKNLTSEQLKTLSLEQIRSLNEQQIAALNYNQLATFTTQNGLVKQMYAKGGMHNELLAVSNTLYFWLTAKQKLFIPRETALQLIDKQYHKPSREMILSPASSKK